MQPNLNIFSAARKLIAPMHSQTGDPTRFPSNVGIVVGPDFTATHLPAYPSNPNSEMLEEDFVYVYPVLGMILVAH